jgi:hypothetical protein
VYSSSIEITERYHEIRDTGYISVDRATSRSTRDPRNGSPATPAHDRGPVCESPAREDFLREQLGAEDYDAYRRRVPMLVPFPRR